MAYKTGTDRLQLNLFPINLEEGISSDNTVRVIDTFVDWLDLSELGFQHSSDNLRGTSMYMPSMLLKLYLYGYLNRIRSSRRLETECTRNIELHWLLHRLRPAYHTIADFRKDNSVAIKGAFKKFTEFCIAATLVEGETVAIDGTKIHAQNNRKNNFNAARLERLLTRIESRTQEYEQYLKDLDIQDKQESQHPKPILHGKSKEEVLASMAILQERQRTYKEYQSKLLELKKAGCSTEELQISTIDPDARALSFKQANTEVGYNIQTASDAKNKIIVHFEVTNVIDSYALAKTSMDTKTALNLKKEDNLNVLADTGYHTGTEFIKCANNGITTFVNPPQTPKNITLEGEEKFGKDKFKYDKASDTYTCPNQEILRTNGKDYIHKGNRKGLPFRKYKQYTLKSSTCQQCPYASKCQGNRFKQSHGRIIERIESDDLIEANRKRIQENKGVYQRRKELIEHPFGTIKRGWGYNYTLVKTKEKVSGEFALVFLCYNLRRAMSILGNKALKEALKRHFLCFEASFKAFTDILFMKTIKSFKLQLSLGGH
jgi:transposase